jgi:hypothetical protein
MDNSYFTQVAPYFQQQDQGLSPVFQNIAQQQQNQNAALQQQNQQVQQAGQQQGSSTGGLNPMAMAAMLRGKKPEMMGTGQTPNWTNPYANYNNGGGVGLSGIE